jgi:hypothetical protein
MDANIEMSGGKQEAEASTEVLLVEYWRLDRLIPYARNARTHSEAQIAEIAGSIRAFGFASPILVGDEGDIVAGHGRLATARKLGLVEVPVIVLRGLSDVERRQLVLADNRIALNAGWDAEMLSLELKDLSALGADLSSLGFDKKELAAALAPDIGDGLTDEDAVPEAGEKSVSRIGDVWLLGPHRLACEDSTDPESVAGLLGNIAPLLMVTDPPYGVAYDPMWRHRSGINQSARTGKVKNDNRADWSAAWELFPGTIAYVWHGALHATTVAESLIREGFTIRAQIIWAKDAWSLVEAIIIGNMSPHGMRFVARETGWVIGDKQPCGTFLTRIRIPIPSTVRKNPTNACDGRSSITQVPGRRSMTHLSAAAPH